MLLPLEDADDPADKLRSLKAKFKCGFCVASTYFKVQEQVALTSVRTRVALDAISG